MDNLLYFTNIKMTDVNELELPTIDPEMESEAQAIANYEDELAEFINLYKKDRGFREELLRKDELYIMYEDWDECYWLYHGDDIEFMSIHLDKCIEKMFNMRRQLRQKKLADENNLPF